MSDLSDKKQDYLTQNKYTLPERAEESRLKKYGCSVAWNSDMTTVIVSEGQKTVESAEQQSIDLGLLLRTFRGMTDIQELTPTLVEYILRFITTINQAAAVL